MEATAQLIEKLVTHKGDCIPMRKAEAMAADLGITLNDAAVLQAVLNAGFYMLSGYTELLIKERKESIL